MKLSRAGRADFDDGGDVFQKTIETPGNRLLQPITTFCHFADVFFVITPFVHHHMAMGRFPDRCPMLQWPDEWSLQ